MPSANDRSSCPSVFEAGFPSIDYDHCRNPDEAFEIIHAARRQAPIALGPRGPELLSYELVQNVLLDPRFCIPRGMYLAAQGVTSCPLFKRFGTSLLSYEEPEHQRLRSLVLKAFTPRAVVRLRATIVEVIAGLVDRYALRGHCEVVTEIARPYPVPIICALLGSPIKDWGRFSDWVEGLFKVISWDGTGQERIVLAAWKELDAYTDDMIARRRETLTDDLISGLIRVENNGDRFSTRELRSLITTLLMAGADTTRHQLAASVQALCDHPDQWALLGQCPDLAANAVEETMRHSPVTFSSLRRAVEDVEIAGVLIPAGTLVIANGAAANRDPAVYADPDRLDITREGATPMVLFGVGAHDLLGANLARLELAEALALMAERMPNIRRTGPVRWKPLGPLSGPTSLPIEFDI